MGLLFLAKSIDNLPNHLVAYPARLLRMQLLKGLAKSLQCVITESGTIGPQDTGASFTNAQSALLVNSFDCIWEFFHKRSHQVFRYRIRTFMPLCFRHAMVLIPSGKPFFEPVGRATILLWIPRIE